MHPDILLLIVFMYIGMQKRPLQNNKIELAPALLMHEQRALMEGDAPNERKGALQPGDEPGFFFRIQAKRKPSKPRPQHSDHLRALLGLSPHNSAASVPLSP